MLIEKNNFSCKVKSFLLKYKVSIKIFNCQGSVYFFTKNAHLFNKFINNSTIFLLLLVFQIFYPFCVLLTGLNFTFEFYS